MSDDDNNNNLPPDDNSAPPPPVIESSDGGSEGFSFDEGALNDPDEGELNRSGSALGRSSKKALGFGVALIGGTVLILYYLFSDTPPPPPPAAGGVVPTQPSGELVAQPSSAPPATIGMPTPSLPSAPPAPPPPPPPPAPPAPPPAVKAAENAPPPKPKAPLAPPEIKAINQSAAVSDAARAAADKRSAQRMRSNMLLLNAGKSGDPQAKKDAKSALDENDPNAAFTSNTIEASEAEVTTATKISNLNNTIAQGKIVNAVLETAINTDLPGTLRAIVSRDVYPEAGRMVMIPKGSRLIGTYNTGILRGQKRVLIVWTRVITPDGTDVAIGSPAIDSLGRAGVGGQVDNKYMETFTGAILTSVITLGVAYAADNIVGNSTTTNNTDGSSTTSGSAGASAANAAVQNIGSAGTGVLSGLLDVRPTITVDQGTRVSVFVNKDLIFPTNANSGGMFVQ